MNTCWQDLLFKKGHWRLYGFESISGGYYRKDTPVPIPNTAVKLPSADNTWMATSRKDRSLPDLYERLNEERSVFLFARIKRQPSSSVPKMKRKRRAIVSRGGQSVGFGLGYM